MITDYATLQESIAEWLVRPDLDQDIPTFIQFAEAHFNRVLRVRQMMDRSRVTTENRYVALPADWRKAWNIQLVGSEIQLDYLSPGEMDKKRHAYATGQEMRPSTPLYFSLFGSSMELLPAPSAPVTIEMLYWRRINPLSDDDPTNWLLREAPDVYLYGALTHSAPFLKEDERLATWEKLYKTAIAELNIEDADSRRSGAPMSRPQKTL